MGMTKEKTTKYVLSEEQISNIVTIAAGEGVKAYKEEHQKAEKDRQSRILNNAKVLIKNYRRFKSLCEQSVYKIEDADDPDLKDVLEMMQGKSSKNYEIISIKDRVVRTKIIMDHVDAMIAVFKKQCEVSTDPEELRRYRVIDGLYLTKEPKSVRDIVEEESITVSTVYRDAEKAFKKLAILFFGIDGVKL